MLSQSLFYFPSTLVWLDDDLATLTHFSAPFETAYPSKKFSDPNDAAAFFEHYTPPLSLIPFLNPIIEDDKYDTLNHSPVDFNVLSIPALRDYTKRQQEISVLISDLNMPNLNGIELCQRLEGLPMKKILLTSEEDHKLAISAFNEGIIDKFILKSQENASEKLQKHIQQLSQQYFVERSQFLLSHLEAEHRLPTSDPVFIHFFKTWCEENNIQEYYLFDKNGSFVCINKDNKIFHFIIYTNKNLDYLAKLYKSQEIPGLYEPITARSKIPFLGIGKESWQFHNPNWNDHLYNFNILKGREDYYWVVV